MSLSNRIGFDALPAGDFLQHFKAEFGFGQFGVGQQLGAEGRVAGRAFEQGAEGRGGVGFLSNGAE